MKSSTELLAWQLVKMCTYVHPLVNKKRAGAQGPQVEQGWKRRNPPFPLGGCLSIRDKTVHVIDRSIHPPHLPQQDEHAELARRVGKVEEHRGAHAPAPRHAGQVQRLQVPHHVPGELVGAVFGCVSCVIWCAYMCVIRCQWEQEEGPGEGEERGRWVRTAS